MVKAQIKNCAVYTRVSTNMQAEKDFSSCESQEEKIRAFVKSQTGWQIAKVYTDAGYTGANINRPALKELFDDIKQNKIDFVLTYKIDRLTRSPKDFYQLIEFFENNNVSFISITERFDTSTPAGRLLRNIMLTFAQFERELTSERTKDKMLERAKKGMYNGGFAPFGYKRKDKKLFICEKEAEIIRLIFETYVENQSLDELYNLLKDKNIKNRQDNPFRKTALSFLLRNPVYAGKVKYNNEIYQGIHKPIIAEELFELAQTTHPKKIRKLRVYKDYLFGGLVNCEECKSKMTPCFANKRTQGKLTRYYYYRCTSTHHKGWDACPTKQVSADRLEKYILENLERISLDKSYIENLVFRLNHSVNTDTRSGYEPSQVCSKFSPEAIINLLQNFLSALAERKGMERNLFAKRFIKDILYSKENIKITLFYSENSKKLKNSPPKKMTDLLSQGSQKFSETQEGNSFPSYNSKFVSNMLAPGLGLEPRLPGPEPGVLPLDDPGLILSLITNY